MSFFILPVGLTNPVPGPVHVFYVFLILSGKNFRERFKSMLRFWKLTYIIGQDVDRNVRNGELNICKKEINHNHGVGYLNACYLSWYFKYNRYKF